jgi:hypothetical protein
VWRRPELLLQDCIETLGMSLQSQRQLGESYPLRLLGTSMGNRSGHSCASKGESGRLSILRQSRASRLELHAQAVALDDTVLEVPSSQS